MFGEIWFEIWNLRWENLVKYGGRTFLPATKAQEILESISGQISEQNSGNISETSFQISRLLS